MAEEFHTGVCSGNWWRPMRGGFDGATLSAATAVSCSASVSEAGSFRWTMEMMESKAARPGEESAASVSDGSVAAFYGTSRLHTSDPMSSCGFLMEPVVGSGLSTPSMDWSQAFIRNSKRGEGGFDSMLHDHLSSGTYLGQATVVESDQVHTSLGNPGNLFKDFDEGFMKGQTHLNSGSSTDAVDNVFQGVSFACSSSLLHGLLDQDVKPQSCSFDTNFMSPPTSHRSSSADSSPFNQFLKASPPPEQQQQQQPTAHLQFSDERPFWKASAAAGNSTAGFCASAQTQFFMPQAFEEKPCSNNAITGKANSEGSRDSSSVSKKSGSEPAFKKPRIETPSPLPTFKVRKEKLGDRITALQQLVSPFGKTDTASVLYEAIESIRFLHDQVGVLSTPYLKNGPAMQQQQQQNSEKSRDVGDVPKQDLRSRGLCLVPISVTFPVVNEPTADFWTPTFGGTYR